MTRRAGCALATLFLAACAQVPPPRPAFEAWRPAHEAAVSAFVAHLAAQGVADVLPLGQLLRSASSWHDCASEPYAVPPPTQWPAVVSVLGLVRELAATGVLGRIEVHSGYRHPALNTCAGGAERSAHALAFAIDFTPQEGPDPTPALCEFWRTRGRGWQMGFGRYASGRIHVDTSGYRTWGAGPTGSTAVCHVG